MTSMFDQYNTTLRREENPTNPTMSAAMTSSGLVSVRTKAETPMFQKKQLSISFPKDVQFMRVANNWMVVLMSNNTLLRMNLRDSKCQNGNGDWLPSLARPFNGGVVLTRLSQYGITSTQ